MTKAKEKKLVEGNSYMFKRLVDHNSSVEPILIGYKVLMITNTSEILLECVDQTSST